MNYADVYAALRRRKLAQTVVVYGGASWGILQVLSFFVSTYGWSRSVIDAALFVLACGLVGAVTIAWFHGEKGEQQVTRLELTILALVALVAVSGGWALARRNVDEGVADDGAPLSDERLAVLPFENRTGDPSLAWLQQGLPEMLATDLGQLPKLHVVSGERVFDLLKQQGVAEAAIIPDPLAMRVAKKASAATLVRGDVYRLGGEYRLDVRLIRASSGLQLQSAHGTGPDLLPLVDTVAARLAAQLEGVTGDTARMSTPLADMATGNLEAYREYQLGLNAQRAMRLRDALPHFRRAVQLDSTFSQALLYLAIAESNTGGGPEALHHLLMAQRNLAHGTQKDSLYVEAVMALAQHDDAVARARFTTLTQKYPDEKDAWLALSSVEPDEPSRRAALLKVLALDPLYSPAYNALAYDYLELRQYARADSFAQKYAQVEPKEPNPLDTRGEVQELWGHYADARAWYLAALRMRPEFTNTLPHLVRAAERSGRLEEARADLAPYVASATPLVRVSALEAVGESYLWQGRLDDAEKAYQQAYDAAAGADPQLHNGALSGLAGVWLLEGQAQRVEQILAPVKGPTSMLYPYLAALGDLHRLSDMQRELEGLEQYAAHPGVAAFAGGALHQVRAIVAYYRGDWARTVGEFRAARQAMREPPDTYLDRREVLALVNLGRAAEALPLVKDPDPRALSAGSLNTRLYLRGRVNEALGRRAEAASAYRQLVGNWGRALPRIPSMSDVPQRLAKLGG